MKPQPNRSSQMVSSPWTFLWLGLLLLLLLRQICWVVVYEEEKPVASLDTSTVPLSIGDYATKMDSYREILQYISRPGRGYIPQRHELPLSGVIGSYWWLNQSVPESFSFAQLDRTYNKEYFDFGGHPDRPEHVFAYTTLVQELCRLFLTDDNKINSLVEFGNGGGYFAKGFLDMFGEQFVTVEGTGAGVATTLERYHVPASQVVQHDLRLPLYLGRRFDVAVCSEVVEHVEPPFASQIVLTLVLHADVIWFSYKTDSPNHLAWINHPNERPLKMWKNLFEFYGFGVVRLSESVVRKSFYRGQFIAYNLGNPHLRRPSLEELQQAEATADDKVAAAALGHNH